MDISNPFADLAEYDKFLSICKKNELLVFKYGDMVLQFQPKMPEFGEPKVPENAQVPGGWKRTADLED